MDSNLLKALLSKAGGIPGKLRAAMLGGDEAMAGAAGAGKFKTGGKGYSSMGAGGKYAEPGAASAETGLGMGRPVGGPLATDVQSIRPMDNMEKLKMMLARMTPEQKAALLGAGGGLAVGGLGGYMAGGEGE